jgi:hypothetical protein
MLIGKEGLVIDERERERERERECPSLLVSSFNEGNRSTTTTTTTLKDTLLIDLLHLNMTHPIHSFNSFIHPFIH